MDVLTLFPDAFPGPLDESILRRARENGLLDLRVHDLRDYTHDRHRTVDDRPFGGGPGMLIKPEPVFEAVESLGDGGTLKVLLDPSGARFDQETARRWSKLPHLILICGSYEGFDARIRENLVDECVSIGDFVLTNGTLPAMIIVDAVTRLLNGVLGDDESASEESFSQNTIEYPQYTRPADFRGMKVPEVLLSGHHARIQAWRKEKSMELTRRLRPDLLDGKKQTI